MGRRKTPEAKLATFWRRRAGLDWSEFDVFDPSRSPPPVGTRQPALDLTDERLTIGKIQETLTWLIWNGFPLSYAEFQIAKAIGLILGDVPYEVFYRTRWSETAERRGYRRGYRLLTPNEIRAIRQAQRQPGAP